MIIFACIFGRIKLDNSCFQSVNRHTKTQEAIVMSKKIMVYSNVYSSKDSILKEWKNGLDVGTMSIGRRYIEPPVMAEHYGFTMDKNVRSSINELEAETVKDIFEMHLFGIPISGIIQNLILFQNPLPKGFGEWSTDLIQEILADERYAGYQFISDDGSVIPIEVGRPIVAKRIFAAAQVLDLTEDDLPQMERLNRFIELMG